MQAIKIGQARVELYDSITEIPSLRFDRFTTAVLRDADIGSDLESIDRRIQRVGQYVGVDDESARVELMNLRQALVFAMQGIDTTKEAFYPLVYSVNGRVWPVNYTESDKQELQAQMNARGFMRDTIVKAVSVIKKKLIRKYG